MNGERWKRRSLGGSLPQLSQVQTESSKDLPESAESKRPRALTKALRTLSTSSLESISPNLSRNPTSARRLQKTPSNAGSMIERLHRRVSKDSGISSSASECSGSTTDQPFNLMEILHYGPLRVDTSLLKARSEYLVLSDYCLVKFGSVEAARGVFPQLMVQNEGAHATGSANLSSLSSKAAAAEVRFEIPLSSIVALYNEEGSSPRFGIEIWWFSPWPRLAFCKAHFFFALPKERDDWLAAIQRAYRARFRKAPNSAVIPENLKTRISHVVGSTEPTSPDGSPQNLTFPVVKRTIAAGQRGNSSEEAQHIADVSSFYLVIGPCMCYFVEVLRADYVTAPGDLRIKVMSFGTVTLTRFKASVASHEQRFVMSFRAPFGRETRLDLASTHYRRIIEALTKIDRILKPMWPQHFQQVIFDIKGLPTLLHLTSGNDLGGLERSLQAHCTAFNAEVPRWTIEWNASSQATFRLLPSQGSPYSPPQLLACFRALRYNSFFKAISLRDVDLSALTGKKDYSQYGDTVVYTSLTGINIPEELHDVLLQAPVLTQEIHALIFASESVRAVDLTNVFGHRISRSRQSRTQLDYATYQQMSSEITRPILMLLRWQLCLCHSLSLSGNPLAGTEVEDLANVLMLDHVSLKKLDVASCGLGDTGLSKLWAGICGQAHTLESLDTSDNQGTAKFETIRNTLSQLRAIKKLNMAGNTRLDTDAPLLDEAAINQWSLQELDLSGISLNDSTVDVLAHYLETVKSQNLNVLRLNKCGLTGRQIGRLFRGMGQGRRLTMHLGASRLDDGIDDLCGAIACGFGPWSLFLPMVEFVHEESYVKLWRALTVGKTIECLSLAGSATPDAVSDTACQAVSEFFVKNETVRFLDISGYDAKLDEGRLGPEFSKALIGIRSNKRLEHLRVRSQMLNLNIGDLAEAIAGNKTLHTLDCESNDFNLSNFRHLIRHLEENMTIRYFSAFSERDLHQTVRKSVDSAGSAPPSRRASVISLFKHDWHEKAQSNTEAPLVLQLKDEWDSSVSALQRILMRNQGLLEFSEHTDENLASEMWSKDWDGDRAFSSAFGGLALRDYESRRAKGSHGSNSPVRQDSLKADVLDTPEVDKDPGIKFNTQPFSEASSEAALSGGSDNVSTDSGAPTPPELDSPTKKEFSIGSSSSAELTYDHPNEGHYSYADMGPEDQGLRMKSHRRFQSDPASRIDEEASFEVSPEST